MLIWSFRFSSLIREASPAKIAFFLTLFKKPLSPPSRWFWTFWSQIYVDFWKLCRMYPKIWTKLQFWHGVGGFLRKGSLKKWFPDIAWKSLFVCLSNVFIFNFFLRLLIGKLLFKVSLGIKSVFLAKKWTNLPEWGSRAMPGAFFFQWLFW